MADANAIAVKISADASGFRAGALEAEEHTSALRAKLIELKGEHVQSARVARFYANEIAEIVPGAEAARASLQALVRVGLAEGAWGAAIAGVGFLVAAFHNLSEAEDEAKEHFRKLSEESEQYAKAALKHLADVRAALRGDSESDNLMRNEGLPLLREKIRLIDKLHDAQAHLAEIESNTDENGGVADIVGLVKAQKEIERLKNELGPLQERLTSKLEESGGIGEAVSDSDRRKKAAEDLNALLQDRLRLRDAENIVDTALWSKDVERQQVAFDTAEALKAQQVAERDMFRDAENIVDAQHAAADAVRLAAEAAAEEAKEIADAKAEAKKLATELGHAALQMGEAAGDAFKGMLDGSKEVGAALQDLLVQMVEIALRFAALRELASGDLIGAAVLGAGSVIAGAFGSGGGHNSNISVTQNFHGGASPGSHSLEMERTIVDVIRRAQSRGRLT